MNTTAYTPEPGSLAERVSTWLRRNREEELTPRDIATKFDVPVQGLHFTLRDAMHHGWITRQGSNGSYSAGPLLPVAGALGGEPAKPAPLVGSRRFADRMALAHGFLGRPTCALKLMAPSHRIHRPKSRSRMMIDPARCSRFTRRVVW